jgi:hypothetical protein
MFNPQIIKYKNKSSLGYKSWIELIEFQKSWLAINLW